MAVEGSPASLPHADRARRTAERPPTLKDVAARAGVSYQTVSRVINGDPRVRDSTRTAVLAAVGDLGFEPSAAARALVTGRSRVLGVLVEDVGQVGPTGTLQGLNAAAPDAGWDLALATLPAGDAAAVPGAVASLKRRGVRAVLLVCGTAAVVEAALTERPGVPLVGASQWCDPLLAAGVEIDQRTGVRLAVDHLVGVGRRRIAQIAGPAESMDAALRSQEVRRALAEHGLEPVATTHGDWSAASGEAAVLALPEDARPDGLLVANDQMALGALAALRRQSRRVPEDVSVVGFDDLPESAYFVPPLTTVRQDFVALGSAVVEVLEDVLLGAERTSRVVVPALVVRGTSVPGGGSPQRR